MSNYSDISFSQADGIARITVERPGKLNAYRNETADELHDALRPRRVTIRPSGSPS